MRGQIAVLVVALAARARLGLAQDTSYATMQRRGQQAMGVDQYTSIHKFDSSPDGGRIELQRDRDDSAGVAIIRSHLRAIAAAFSSGDFSAPDFVHMQMVPGTRIMAATALAASMPAGCTVSAT